MKLSKHTFKLVIIIICTVSIGFVNLGQYTAIIVAKEGLPPQHDVNTNQEHQPSERLAVANFVEGPAQLYGVFSIHRQLLKYNMSAHEINSTDINISGNNKRVGGGGMIDHVVVAPTTIHPNYHRALVSWLGEDNVRLVEPGYLLNRIRSEQHLWKKTFQKLWLYNLTEYDKVIVLDADILIRTNIMHWFEYDTPCGIQAKDDVAWNSGAMVITPDTAVFEQMLSQLPNVIRYEGGTEYHEDPLTGGYSDQDFLTAFFLTNETAKQRCVMPTEAAILISSMGGKSWDYYEKFRPWLYQTVHFTILKPWEAGKHSQDPFICSLLREWKESIVGIEAYYNLIPPIMNDYLVFCIARPEGKFWYPTAKEGTKTCMYGNDYPIQHAHERAREMMLFDSQADCCATYPDACPDISKGYLTRPTNKSNNRTYSSGNKTTIGNINQHGDNNNNTTTNDGESKSSQSLTELQLNIVRNSTCTPNMGPDWKVLCDANVVEIAARLLARGDHVDVVQIGAHVGFEGNDPVSKGLSRLLDEIVKITTKNELRKQFHWTFIEPSPPNFKRLSTNILQYSHVCDMNIVNAAVVSDLTENPGEMVFHGIRDTIDPETGFDSLSKKTFPYWITQISSFSKRTMLKVAAQFSQRGLDIEDYIIETNVTTMSYSDLMNQVSHAEEDKKEPLIVLIDTEGLDCDIVEGISPDSPFLPKYLIFEHKHCKSENAEKHLQKMGYVVHKLKENVIAVRQSPSNTTTMVR